MALAPALIVARPVTAIVVPFASVIAPADVSVRLVALTPVSSVAESSVTVTAPPVRFSVPKLVVSPASSPSVMALAPALNVARPVTASVVDAASVIAPPAVSVRLLALTPVSTVAESSVTVTAPPVRLSVPKSVESPALSPSVMALAPALIVARPVTAIVVLFASVIAPADVSVRLVALTPVSAVDESSVTVTAPPVRSSVPKSVVSPASSPSVMALAPALNVASPVTVTVVAATSVIAPLAVTVKSPPTVTTPSSSAAPTLVSDALPLVPVVARLTEPP